MAAPIDPEKRFPIWFYYGRLRGLGWPRERGLFRKTHFVNSMIADSLLLQLMAIGLTVGAGDRETGYRLIANCFPERDWAAPFGHDELEFLEDARGRFDRLSFVQTGRDVSWQVLGGGEVATYISSGFAGFVWSGITDANAVIDSVEQETAAPGAATIGSSTLLGHSSLPDSFAQQLEDASSLVADFKESVGPLPEVPAVLAAAAEDYRAEAASREPEIPGEIVSEDLPVVGTHISWAQVSGLLMIVSPGCSYVRFAERQGDKVSGPPRPQPYAQVEVDILADRRAFDPSKGEPVTTRAWLPILHREDFKVVDWTYEVLGGFEGGAEIAIGYDDQRGFLGRFQPALSVMVFPLGLLAAHVAACEGDLDALTGYNLENQSLWTHDRGAFKVPAE